MRRLPKLRTDLIVSKHRQGDQTVFVVKDPVTNRFFRFVAFQYYVATHLDGETPLESIRASLAARFNRPVNLESVEAFVERLDRSGLLEDERARAPDMPHVPEQKGLLYYKIPLVNPGRWFDALYRRVRFCFSTWFTAVSLVWMALAVLAVTSDWDACVKEFLSLLRLEPTLLLSIYLTLLFVVTVHEIAHGLAVHHFGGRVRDAGTLFMYFQWCFYTDVSDSYLFPSKRARTVVMLAGVYSGALIASTAAVLWRITDPFSWLHHAGFLVMCVAGTNLIFNFNPLIKLDGYYILNDWVDIPNLRQKAFGFLSARIRSVLGLVPGRIIPASRRDRFIYIAYGVTASVYSGGLILLFALLVKDAAIEYAPELALFGFVLGTVAAVKKSVNPSDSNAVTPDERMPRRARRVSGRTYVWLGLLALALICMIFIDMELRVSAPFELRAVRHTVIRAEVEGQLDRIFVDEGDTVQAGQVLARLSTRDIDARLRAAQAEYERAEAELALLKSGARQEEIDHAQAVLHQAQAGLEAARKASERAEALARQEVIAPETLDEARTALALKQAEVEQAHSRLNLLKAGARPEEIDAKLAEIQGLKSTMAYLEEQRRLCTITSPMTGIVTTRYFKERRNEYVEIGDPVCELIDHRALRVEIAVPEREVGDVRAGFPVKLKARGYPSLSFEGRVTAISPVASDREGEPVLLVESEIPNGDGTLKAGMTGSARIYCGQRPVGALMLRRIVRYIRTEFWW